MKKHILFLSVLLLFSCLIGEDEEPAWITFEEVSQPYLDQYGQPEDTYGTVEGGYITWYWCSQGVAVNFMIKTYGEYNGWTVNHFHEFTTFVEVSQPYLDQRGWPEDVYHYISGEYQSIDWWWWSQGFMVCFVSMSNTSGWEVDHTYSFEPF